MLSKKKLSGLFLILVLAVAAYFFVRHKNKKPVDVVKVTAPVVPPSKYNTLAVTATFFTDMEDPDRATWIGERSAEKFFSGKFSNKLSDKAEYGMTLSKKGIEIPQHEKVKQVRISFQLFSKIPLKKASIVYAVNGTKNKAYEYFQEEIHGEANKWNSAEFILNVNAASWGEDAAIKIYPWNPGKEVFYIDDIKIEFYSELETQSGIVLSPQQNYVYDFEPSADPSAPANLCKDVSHSGNFSLKLSGADSYSDNILKRFSEIANDTIKFISTSVWIYPKEDNPIVTLVVSIEKPDGKSISWQGKATDKMNLAKNEWHKINFRADLREIKTSPDDNVKIYLWNKKGGTVYADDLEIVYGDIPKPIGTAPGLTMNIGGDPTGTPENNKAPFPWSYFSASTLFTPASVFLVDGDDKKEGEMDPANISLAGNFLSHNDAHDDLFIAGKNKWSIYSWCGTEKRFVQTFTESNDEIAAGKMVLHGYFEDIKQEEILLIDTTGKTQIQTFRFNNSSGNNCDLKIQDGVKMHVSSEVLPGPNFISPFSIAAGNFAGDNRQEIIAFTPDGQWRIYEKEKISWSLMGTGKIERGTMLSIHPVPFGNHDKLIMFYEKNHKLDYCLLDFSNGKNCSLSEFRNKSFLSYYSSYASFLSGSYEKANAPVLFYLNKEWRFDLKKVRITVDGIFIESMIDFQQPDANRNPKYYEYTKLLGGKFFDPGTDYLLMMMRNCRDLNFDGKTCTEYEEVKGMPSGYLFYQYNKID
ncbi:MAG: hypothetical protein ABI763_03260 [Bacteroidota bacterium]